MFSLGDLPLGTCFSPLYPLLLLLVVVIVAISSSSSSSKRMSASFHFEKISPTRPRNSLCKWEVTEPFVLAPISFSSESCFSIPSKQALVIFHCLA